MTELLIVSAAACMTCAALYLWLGGSRPKATAPQSAPLIEPRTFLFDDEVLHHATDTARAAFPMVPGAHYWGDLRVALQDRFPDFPDHHATGPSGQMTLYAKDPSSPQQADIAWRDTLCWVTLTDTEVQTVSKDTNSQELASLRRINDTAPSPAWEQAKDGKITWYNAAYATLYEKVHDTAPDTTRPLFVQDAIEQNTRVKITYANPDTPADWFELAEIATDTTTVFHASHITAVVNAEQSQRNFVQTLAKTFAHLSIGLAIFDRNRQLVLFNPALVDLTNLPGQFLSARPDLLSFFDQLREKRRMPEPKNYTSWREEIAQLITAAADGRYEETWTLETGQTYNVKGRPHPDGAIAFLIEDISAEMTLTRSFRAELEQAQILLDGVTDAIAIFSPAGVLTFSNAAFQTLWRISPDSAFADMTLRDCAAIWKRRARSGADIHAITAFISENDLSDTRKMTLRLGDETVFDCQMEPAASGGIMVRFQPEKRNRSNRQKPEAETVQ